MDTRLKGRKGYIAIKFDMSKTYDWVEWKFLEGIMRKMGFANGWVKVLITCVTTPTYSVLVNGIPTGKIIPTRGLWQGDPLSPYLLMLCSKGLSSLLLQAEMEGRLTSIPISALGFKLSHLFFADDSLIFCRANFSEWNTVQPCFKYMRKPRVKSSMWRKHPSSLARIQGNILGSLLAHWLYFGFEKL